MYHIRGKRQVKKHMADTEDKCRAFYVHIVNYLFHRASDEMRHFLGGSQEAFVHFPTSGRGMPTNVQLISVLRGILEAKVCSLREDLHRAAASARKNKMRVITEHTADAMAWVDSHFSR